MGGILRVPLSTGPLRTDTNFMMQHKYPFYGLASDHRGDLLDINVHPTKMELLFQQRGVYRFVTNAVRKP